jgi:hypothetical protein
MLENNLEQNAESKKYCFIGEFIKKDVDTGKKIQTNDVIFKFFCRNCANNFHS